MSRAIVTGIGLISAIGNNVHENHQRLKSGTTGIGRARHLDSKYKEKFFFGEVNLSNSELKQRLSLKEKDNLSRTDLLAFTGFEEAVAAAQLTPADLSSFETAFLSGSTVGGMSETNDLYQDVTTQSNPSNFIDTYPGNAHLLRIVNAYGLKGYTDVINTACSSSANAIMLGVQLIESGRAKRAIVGGVDSLAKFTVNGFNSLQIFSQEVCKPFDKNRNGLNLGEGCAYLVLENEELAKDKKQYAVISGYGNSNDAFHASSLSEEATGVKLSIQTALDKAAIGAKSIDYINTHGTATENNDRVELTGIKAILGHVPPYNSTKSYTGHTLGAAGAIEAVFSILSLVNNEVYPSLNWQETIDGFPTPISSYTTREIKHVLSNSFGFAGNCSSLIISKI